MHRTDFSDVEIKVTKVRDNVYMLKGAGGNIGFSAGPDGVVLVDDQFAPLADRIKAALKAVTDQPLRFIINTHYHFDHIDGNASFQKEAPVIAHHNVRRRLETGGNPGNFASVRQELKSVIKEALPILTFSRDVTIYLNGEDIQVLHYPHGHTDGDSMIYFPKSNVVHMGDDFVTYGFPFVDLAGGGSVEGMITAVEYAIANLPADVKVIPGHGAVSTLDDVRQFVSMMKETRGVIEKAVQAGHELEQLKRERILKAWETLSSDFISTDAFIETLYNDLTGKKSGDFIKHN
jgi:cyclase